MNFEEKLEQKRKERIEREEQEKAKLRQLEEDKAFKRKNTESLKQIPINQIKSDSKTEIRMTLDGIRGLYLISSGKGDKSSNKIQLEQKLKDSLLNPNGFGDFLENLSKYLKSI